MSFLGTNEEKQKKRAKRMEKRKKRLQKAAERTLMWNSIENTNRSRNIYREMKKK